MAKKVEYLQGSSSGINSLKSTEFATNLYPNPTGGMCYLSYEVANTSKVSAAIFDLTGRQVASLLNNQIQGSGKQVISFDVTSLQLPQGLYMIQLNINGIVKTVKLNVQQ